MWNVLFYITYAMLGVCALGAIAGAVMGLANNFKQSTVIVGVLVAVLVVFLITLGISPSEMPFATPKEVTGGLIKLSNGGILTVYGAMIVGFALLAVDIVKGVIQGN